jgi:hypothetical protein
LNRAKITNAGHTEDVGERVHCFVKMKSGDAEGNRANERKSKKKISAKDVPEIYPVGSV